MASSSISGRGISGASIGILVRTIETDLSRVWNFGSVEKENLRFLSVTTSVKPPSGITTRLFGVCIECKITTVEAKYR
eukprot:1000351-Pyramimonas_sp.AAC.1